MDTTPSVHPEPIRPQSLEPGMLIDGFVLEAKLHQGGMATLWQVRRDDAHPSADTLPLIMKVPRFKGGEDPASIVGFEVEQMIMPTLSGPHVPQFVAKGDITHLPYIVMERLPGRSLRDRFDAAPLPLDEVIEIGSRVAEALHDLHRQHVIHLDLKPSNVMFREDGTAVLVDFGLSRHAHLPDLLEESMRLPLGTGPYMSPEQVQFVRSDPRSDLFALGVMLYHFATGQRPFGAPTSVRGLRKRLYIKPTPPRAHREAIPPWLQEIILRCLEVNADQRHGSAAQLALDLQAPQHIHLTARAHNARSGGLLGTAKRWFLALGSEPTAPPPQQMGSALERAAILMVAVDVEHAERSLREKLRHTVRQVMAAEPGARLVCVTVRKTHRIAMDTLVDETGQSLHVKQLVALKHWARPLSDLLRLDETRLSYHVLEAPDPAAAIVDFAERNHVDHIIMGARASGTVRRFLGSVSAQVVAESPCSVTVVRVTAGKGDARVAEAEPASKPADDGLEALGMGA